MVWKYIFIEISKNKNAEQICFYQVKCFELIKKWSRVRQKMTIFVLDHLWEIGNVAAPFEFKKNAKAYSKF